VATLAGAFDHVSAVCLLLGSATGSWGQIAALHGPRLEMMLARMVDSTVRGVVYESAGTVDANVLRAGAEIVRSASRRSRIDHVLLDGDPSWAASWPVHSAVAVERILAN
jgi:hypothetical protein